MRSSVVAAIAPGHLALLGSSAVLEAVDEALAQIVESGAHLGALDDVKALWIAFARRRLIDEERSSEARRRHQPRDDHPTRPLLGGVGGEDVDSIEAVRERWRVVEVMSALYGEERRWAEAWYDEVLASQSGGTPRGLADVLGWSTSKTKTVSRRARRRMAEFIERRADGVVCSERRALLDAMTDPDRAGDGLADERLFVHIAGCEECWIAWRARRRALLGRCSALALVPLHAIAAAADALRGKLVETGIGVHALASSLPARVGIGGAAATGGGAAALGGKTAAVCIGVVCAAAAGGEIAGVLPPLARERTHGSAVRATDARTTAVERQKVVQPAPEAPRVAPPPVAVQAPAQSRPSSAFREEPARHRRDVAWTAPGDLPPARSLSASSDGSGSQGSRATSSPKASRTTTSPTFVASDSHAKTSTGRGAATKRSDFTCVPGSLGC